MINQHLYRNINNGRLYRLYNVSPLKVVGSWIESEDTVTGEIRKLNQSSWRRKDFVIERTI